MLHCRWQNGDFSNYCSGVVSKGARDEHRDNNQHAETIPVNVFHSLMLYRRLPKDKKKRKLTRTIAHIRINFVTPPQAIGQQKSNTQNAIYESHRKIEFELDIGKIKCVLLVFWRNF